MTEKEGGGGRKEDLRLREQREKGIWELRKERKKKGLGTEERERETGGFPTSNEE